MMKMAFRATPLAAVTAAVTAALSAALLAGCGSAVKLDETPVETRTPNAVTASGSPGAAGGATGSGAAAPQSRVATVDLDRAANTPAGGGAAVPPAATLGRLVYFDFDSFVVRDEFRPLVEGHAKALAAAKAHRLVVEGHTDERGGREYNLALGQKRAEAVAKSLVLLGATDVQVEAVSFGKERPADPGHDEDAWAKNRRAELRDR
jgi:peptidoglycan-associated lipoprotein